MTSGPIGLNPSWLQFKIPCSQPQDWEEEIYDDLCYVTFSSTLSEVGDFYSFVRCIFFPLLEQNLYFRIIRYTHLFFFYFHAHIFSELF